MMCITCLWASHLFLITANLRESQVKEVSRLVWMALPMPSTTTRSHPQSTSSSTSESGSRLKWKGKIMLVNKKKIRVLTTTKKYVCSIWLWSILTTGKGMRLTNVQCRDEEKQWIFSPLYHSISQSQGLTHLRSRHGEAWPDSRTHRVPASRCSRKTGHRRVTCFITMMSSWAVTSFSAGLLLAHSTTWNNTYPWHSVYGILPW